jgi:protein-S-isoprenylcysteine O-methyltransferase Ste14
MNLALTRGLAAFRVRTEARPAPARHWLNGERVAKMVIVALFTSLATRLALDWAKTGHVTGLLMLASESLVVVCTIIRRPAGVVDRTLLSRILTAFSTFGPPLVSPASLWALAPDSITIIICGCGLFFVVLGKMSLGRSFGLAPANRGVVSSGLYRFVRHPIYFGYLITHAGFVLANPGTRNLLVLMATDVALLLRAIREENTLAADPQYRDYMQRVRWRVIPGIF